MKKKIIFLAISIICMIISIKPVIAETYDNYNPEGMVSCGNGTMSDIPALLPKVVSIAYTIIQVAVPVVLVIMGSLDLAKGITAQKDDEIKKGQQMFIKRLISASFIFFVFVIVKVVISFVADGTGNEIIKCTECFINNDCEKNDESDMITTKTIIDSIRENFALEDEHPAFVSDFRDGLIYIVDENFKGSNDALIKEIERRLNDGDEDLREKLINFLYYSL